MNRFLSRIIVGTLLSAGYLGPLTLQPVQANPTTSPSARAAARLKHNPPRGWIRHYLGDDRYKILGGTWKVVSTELDQYYYPAWAPEMLRQPAGRVIGFPSAAAAEEAGYRRSNYPMDQPTLNAQPVPGSSGGGLSTTSAQGTTITTNRGRASRVVLSDGTSTVLLPQGWTHARVSRSIPVGQRSYEMKFDMLSPLPITSQDAQAAIMAPRQRSIMFSFTTLPGMNAEALIDPRNTKRLITSLNQSSGRVNTNSNNIMNSLEKMMGNQRAVRFAGLKGVETTWPRGMAGMPANTRVISVARGSKIYSIVNLARGVAGSNTVLNSFQPR